MLPTTGLASAAGALAIRRGQIVTDGRCGFRFIDGAGQQARACSGKAACDGVFGRRTSPI
jgi:hypothetical protein